MDRAGHRNCGLLIAGCELKKKKSKSEIQLADAFCPEDPCPRATTQASRIFKLWMAAAKERIYSIDA
jgi:hypothetical protein